MFTALLATTAFRSHFTFIHSRELKQGYVIFIFFLHGQLQDMISQCSHGYLRTHRLVLNAQRFFCLSLPLNAGIKSMCLFLWLSFILHFTFYILQMIIRSLPDRLRRGAGGKDNAGKSQLIKERSYSRGFRDGFLFGQLKPHPYLRSFHHVWLGWLPRPSAEISLLSLLGLGFCNLLPKAYL